MSQSDETGAGLDAFEALLSQNLPDLRAHVRRAGGAVLSDESSEDLVQSACLEVLRRCDEFRHGGDEGFRRWLYTIAARKLADRARRWGALKRRANGAFVAPDAAADPGPTPSGLTRQRERLDEVVAAMASLPAEQREVILLARLLEMPRAEIGEVTGRSEEAVRSLLYRAMGKLGLILARESGV